MYLAVCDDQRDELAAVTALIERWQSERHVSLHFRTFRSGPELLDAADRERFTLYLLDVMMPGMSGLDTAREIRTFDDTAEIVFLTSSPSFAYESYRVRALDYLLKPVRAELLFSLFDRLWQKEQTPDAGLTVKCGTALVRIPFSQLSYVEVRGKHLFFHLCDGSEREIVGSLNEYAPALLAQTEFARIHRAYIVNMLQISELSPAGIKLFGGADLPVSRLTYPQLQRDYMKLIFAEREG